MRKNKDIEKEIRERWFKDHVIEHSIMKDEKGNEIERLRWRKPGTGVYGVDYLYQDGTLYVSGDLGSAVYRHITDVDCWVRYRLFFR